MIALPSHRYFSGPYPYSFSSRRHTQCAEILRFALDTLLRQKLPNQPPGNDVKYSQPRALRQNFTNQGGDVVVTPARVRDRNEVG